MQQMPQGMMRASDLKGVDVYGSDNQKIGDIDEMVVDRQGKIHAVIVGVGGFLGIGQKDVAIPFDQVQWMSNQEVQAQNNQNNQNNPAATTGSTGAAGGAGSGNMAAPTGGGATGTTTTGAGSGGMAASGNNNNQNVPARAMVKMTKADLQNAPEFRTNPNEGNRGSAGGGTTGTGTTGGAPGAGGAAPTNRP
jgi:sporulation protein YlmC with PRC-barrel domain